MSNDPIKSLSLKGTWKQALLTFFIPIFGVLIFRWLLFEPFVIPSGSMIPTLLVHDHILVNKLSFGIHFPFTETWLVQWAKAKKGQVVVFKYPQNKEIFYVKRVVAVEGDSLEVREGELWINDKKLPQEVQNHKSYSGQRDEDEFDYYREFGHTVRYRQEGKVYSEFAKVTVPPGHFFVMGDNRDQSSDSRVWGMVPNQYLVGEPLFIWLSCDRTLPTAPFVCDPGAVRWARLLTGVN